MTENRTHGKLRRWAIQQNPIPKPLLAEIQIRDTVDDFGSSQHVAQIDLPLLSPPQGSAHGVIPETIPTLELARIPHSLAPIGDIAVLGDAATISPDYVEMPVPRRAFFSAATFQQDRPSIIDLFRPLDRPRRDGKAYGAPQHPTSDSPQRPQRHNRRRHKCKHGIPIDQCATCAEAAAHRAQPVPKKVRQRTIDVFDLLLPYLQPPIQDLLEHPILFPPGKRPYGYQVHGIRFLAEHTGALLGDDMGLGKTIQAIFALQILFRRGDIRRVLILCPRSLLDNWEEELKRWSPEFSVLRVRGTIDERRFLWDAPSAVYLTTYETLREDISRHPAITLRFDVTILDEAQRIKNPQAGLSKAVHRLRAGYRWGLSGTPLENKPEDIIAIYKFLVPDLFHRDEVPAPRLLKQRIAPYFLRRRLRDVAHELPEKKTQEVWLELTDRQRRAYQAAYSQAVSELRSPAATRMHAFALTNKLKQICNVDPNSGESCKVQYLLDQLDNVVASGHKALVFSHLPNVTLRVIEPQLRHFDVELFDGTLSDTRRHAVLDAFSHNATPRVLLMSVQAGGVGLNLTAANYVFHFDHWWNPAVARQAEARAHRLKQERTVFVHSLYTRETIEKEIHELLQKKQALFDEIIDDLSSDSVMKTITDEELFGLFGLQPPAKPQPTSTPSASLPRPRPSGPTTTTSPNPSQSAATSQTWLDLVDPIAFEHLVARLYTRMGYVTEVTPASHDHGVDVIARRNGRHGTEVLIIQCKHMPQGTVGESVVRDLVGAWQHHRSAHEAVIVTSGLFSHRAIRLAEAHRIRLIDRTNLRQWFKQYLPEIKT